MRQCPLFYFLEDGAEIPARITAGGFSPPQKGQARGPDDLIGRLATPCNGDWDLCFEPEHQDVTRIPGDGKRVYIVLDRRSRLMPADVLRSANRAGHSVILGDGQNWVIPPARLVGGGSALPRRRVLDEEGKRVWQVEDAYRDLSEAAEKIWAMAQGQQVLITDDMFDEICAAALGVNYRLGLYEAIALGLLTDDGARGIGRALIDYPTVEEILAEKKTADTPAS